MRAMRSRIVVGYDAGYFSHAGQFHELRRASSLLVRIVEHHAVDAPENILQVKAEFRESFQPPLLSPAVDPQRCLSLLCWV